MLNQDGEIDYLAEWVDPGTADAWFLALQNELTWRDEWLRIAGRVITAPRRVAWHGDPGAAYRYSGVTHEPCPWTPALRDIQARLESHCGVRFNSVLGNLYRNGGDAMGWHADNERELGPDPFIASVSLGAERLFEIRHNRSRDILRLPLAHGSLLTMGGSFQAHWRHRVPRQPAIEGPRINLTFRSIISRT